MFSVNYVHKEIDNNIIEYNKIDLSDICNISSCEEIFYKGTIYKNANILSNYWIYDNSISSYKKNAVILPTKTFTYSLGDILSFRLFLDIPEYHIKIKTKPIAYLRSLSLLILFFNIILYLILRYFTYSLLTKVKKDDAISMAGKEAYLVNKNMSLLTAHITHEVKTPLAVLNNQLHIIKNYYEDLLDQVNRIKHPNREIDKIIAGCGEVCIGCGEACLLENNEFRNITNPRIDEAFNTADIYIDSIQNVLNRMQNFKEIKYSNGNKDIYELIEVSFKTLTLYHKGIFEYNIDKKLKGEYISEKLANADILHIFLNHIKNSLQASSTFINISVGKKENSTLIVYMTDNGNGIPINKLHYIFDPKFSTKSHKTNDGIGLYISKQILIEAGGDESVQESSNKGTVFKFILPIKN